MNSAIEECTVSKLGVVVMDELHMLDDDHRGYLMEIMATKLLSLEQNIQMISMSATVSVSLLPIRLSSEDYYDGCKLTMDRILRR